MTLASVQEYDPERVSESRDNAVVVGAGLAGLLAARVLADRFRKVVVVERGPLPEDPIPRRGVPQGNHIHALLRAGRSTIEDLFPGYSEQLLSAGAVRLDMNSDLRHFENGDFVADGPSKLPNYYATRPLIEHTLRNRVVDLDQVEIRSNCQFVEYTTDEDVSAVTGIIIRDAQGDRVDLPADVVVDATGRTSKTPRWLDHNGFTSPPVDEVEIDVAYSTVVCNRPPDDQRALVVVPTESVNRGVGVFPVENGRWLMTYFGMADDQPPTDPDELREYSSSLPGPDPIAYLDTQPLFSEGIDHYLFPSNLRRRYEELTRFPDGLLVVGDAIASFNPIYGQGMSVAALEALLLHHSLTSDHPGSLAHHFFERVEQVVSVAWLMAVGADFSYPHTTGPKPRGTEFFNWYVDRLTTKAHSDGSLRETYYRVINMEYPPTALFRPRTVWRAFNPFDVCNRDLG